jgi:hypothetical protein
MAERRKRRQEDGDPIKYLVKEHGGAFVLEVPADWKITFGYVNPSNSQQGYRQNQGHCMRVWEGEKLRAVFADVVAFRDMSLPLAREVRKETGSSQWTMDSEGNFESSKKVEVETDLILTPLEADVEF